MATLKDEAKAFEPQQKTRNIAELPKVSVNLNLEDDSFEVEEKNDKGEMVKKTVNIKIIRVEGDKFRVPMSVVEQLKIQLEANSNMEFFKVSTSGTGMSTKYTVIPIF